MIDENKMHLASEIVLDATCTELPSAYVAEVVIDGRGKLAQHVQAKQPLPPHAQYEASHEDDNEVAAQPRKEVVEIDPGDDEP